MYRGKPVGRCGSSPASAAPPTPIAATIPVEHGRYRCLVRSAFDFHLDGLRSDLPAPRRSGNAAWRSRRWPTMEPLFAGIPLDSGLDVDDDKRPARQFCLLSTCRGRKRAVPIAKLRGTVQRTFSGVLAARVGVIPVEPGAQRSSSTCSEWARNTTPLWIRSRFPAITSAGGRHRAQERRSLSHGFTYVERGIARGLDMIVRARAFLLLGLPTTFRESPSCGRRRRIWRVTCASATRRGRRAPG